MRIVRVVFIATLIILISSCSRHPSYKAQGYIEGKYTYIATSVSGVLKELLVSEGNIVQPGQKLLVLEAQPESDAYLAARANVQQAIDTRDAAAANLQYAKLTFERNKVLVPKRAIQQSELDRSKASYDAEVANLAHATAAIDTAKANLAQANWTKNQKELTAPVKAIVFETFYRVGEYTVANQAIISLLAPADITAIFYVPEAKLGALQLNDKVEVRIDGNDKIYHGRISFISPSAEYTPPVIYSETTSAKLIYRIEAQFAENEAIQLHPGQPVIVTYSNHE